MATKEIAMITLKKIVVTASLAAAVGAGIYEAHQASVAHSEIAEFKQQQAPLADQIQQLQQERQSAVNQLSSLRDENERLSGNTAELLKLRAQLTQLRAAQTQQSPAVKATGATLNLNDPGVTNFLAARAAAEQITRYLNEMPQRTIPELKLLTEVDWLSATTKAKFDTDADIRRTLSNLRSLAKNRLPMGRALFNFTRENGGQLPATMSQLKPYFTSALDSPSVDDGTVDAILERYKLLHSGDLSALPKDAWIIVEKAPVDGEYDSRAKFGNGLSTIIDTGVGEAGDPDDSTY